MQCYKVSKLIVFVNSILPILSQAGYILSGQFHNITKAEIMVERLASPGDVMSSCGRCASMCLHGRMTEPTCSAYTCDTVTLSCDLYAIDTPLSVFYAEFTFFRFEMEDVFHLISIEGRLYSIYLSSVEKTYLEAWSHCMSLGGHLLHFDSLDEYQAIRMIAPGHTVSDGSFVGAWEYVLNGIWYTERDTTLDPTVWIWAPEEPRYYASGVDTCAYIDHTKYKLMSKRCDDSYSFFCERDIILG